MKIIEDKTNELGIKKGFETCNYCTSKLKIQKEDLFVIDSRCQDVKIPCFKCEACGNTRYLSSYTQSKNVTIYEIYRAFISCYHAEKAIEYGQKNTEITEKIKLLEKTIKEVTNETDKIYKSRDEDLAKLEEELAKVKSLKEIKDESQGN